MKVGPRSWRSCHDSAGNNLVEPGWLVRSNTFPSALHSLPLSVPQGGWVLDLEIGHLQHRRAAYWRHMISSPGEITYLSHPEGGGRG